MYPQNPVLQNMMYCTIEDNVILQCNYGQPLKKIGVTMEKYNDALNLVNEYRNKLIELGVIEKEKTPEDLQRETNALLLKLNQRMDTMEAQLNEYKKFNTNSQQSFTGAEKSSASTGFDKGGADFRKSSREQHSGRSESLK